MERFVDRLRVITLLATLMLWFGAKTEAQTRVLVLGGSQPYYDYLNSGTPAEAAFPPTDVASNLQGILSADAAVSQPATVQAVDTYQTEAATGFSSRTLMSWYYWPATHSNTLALLASNWNYVVMIDDPFVASTYPEYDFEGVLRISQAARAAGASPLLVMTWSSGSTPVDTFGQMAYRVGNGTGVPVAPAGYAWNNVTNSLQDAGTRPTPYGAYVTAATIYSQWFNRSAKTAGFLPSGMPTATRDALADAALATVQMQSTNTHYSGTLLRPTHFIQPLNKNRLIRFGDWDSSTENGISTKFSTNFGNFLVGVSEPFTSPYQTELVPPHQLDLYETRYNYDANLTRSRNFATFDYQDDYGSNSMITGMDRVMYPYANPEQETGAANVTSNYLAQGEYYVPVRVLWARLHEAQPQIVFQPDGWHHMGTPMLNGVAAMMATLLTGRCPIGDEPPNPGGTNSGWQEWFGRKTGYEIACQHATLTAGVAGMLALPSTTTSLYLSDQTSETMSVRFRYAPASNVTVTVSADQPASVVISPATLTFTPANYTNAQTVSVKLVSGSRPQGLVNIQFDTQSGDPTFNNQHDAWPYIPLVSYVWGGGGSNNNSSTAANWNPGSSPGAAYAPTLFFGGNLRTAVAIDFTNASLVNNLIFTNDNSAGKTAAFSLAGNALGLWGNITTIAPTTGSLTDVISNNLSLVNGTCQITVNANGTPSHNLTLAGNISDTYGQGLTKAGTGTLTLSGTNTFSGAVSINGGTLILPWIDVTANPNPLGQSAGDAANLYLAGSTTLQYTGSGGTCDRLFKCSSRADSTVTLDASGTGPVNFNNPGGISYGAQFSNHTRTLALTGSNPGTNTLAATIGDNGVSPVQLIKSGAGTWVLSGTNSYTGTTTVNQGKLVLPTVTGGGAIVVADAGSLGLTVGGPGQTANAASISLGSTAAHNGTLEIAYGAVSPGTAPLTTTGTLAANGTNTVTISGTNLVAGRFPLLSYAGGTLSAGAFKTFRLGTLPVGFNGVLSNNTAKSSIDLNLTLAGGRLTGVALAGRNLVVSGTNGVANGTYVVLASTNLVIPLSNWQPVKTNTFDAAGNFTALLPWDGTASQSFFTFRQ